MKILEIKTKNRAVGDIGEGYATRLLKKKGYKILKTNYVADNNEIDIICESRDTLVFCEVKTRTKGKENEKEPRPASAVTKEKQRAIIKAAGIFTSAYFSEKMKRFDIFEIYVDDSGKVIEHCHIENAFNLNTAYGGYRK